jgi:hypothetical protein
MVNTSHWVSRLRSSSVIQNNYKTQRSGKYVYISLQLKGG